MRANRNTDDGDGTATARRRPRRQPREYRGYVRLVAVTPSGNRMSKTDSRFEKDFVNLQSISLRVHGDTATDVR